MTQTSPGSRARVLVAWDGSEAAAAALPVAQRLAEQLGAGAEALFVAADAAAAEASREERLADAQRAGMPLHLCVGNPADEIVRLTEEPGVVLVALTTHGRRIESNHRLGSVAEAVVAGTRRPVLIIKPESLAPSRTTPLRHLLVPIDGTPKTAAALQPVTRLAVALGASVDLLYVAGHERPGPRERGSMQAPRYVDQPQHEWPEWASEIIHRLSDCCAGWPEHVPVRFFLVQDGVGDEIARFAAENQTDAIVLVRRSRFQPGRAKVIRSVLDQTDCFIIIVGGEES